MFKQLSVIFLLAAFITQTFNRALLVMDYYSNRAAYIKNCINKSTPKMHCNGHCQLMKKLSHEENKDQQNPERKIENKKDLFYIENSNFIPITLFGLQINNNSIFQYISLKDSLFGFSTLPGTFNFPLLYYDLMFYCVALKLIPHYHLTQFILTRLEM